MASSVDRVLITVGFSLLIFFTLLGNSFVLFVLTCRARRLLKNPFYLFIVNICLSDVLATLFTTTFEVHEEIIDDWIFGEVACKTIEYLEMSLFGVNIHTHLAIAIERYHKVVHPLKPPITPRSAKVLLVACWCIPFVIYSPFIYTLSLLKQRDGKTICSISTMPWEWLDKLFLTVQLLVVFLVPLVLLVWLYVLIIRKLYQRKRDIRATLPQTTQATLPQVIQITLPQTTQATLPQTTQVTMRAAATRGSCTSATVAVVFVLCWLPFIVVYFVRLVSGSEEVTRTSKLYVTALYASFFNELLTPFLYSTFDNNIKPVLLDCFKFRLRDQSNSGSEDT